MCQPGEAIASLVMRIVSRIALPECCPRQSSEGSHHHPTTPRRYSSWFDTNGFRRRHRSNFLTGPYHCSRPLGRPFNFNFCIPEVSFSFSPNSALRIGILVVEVQPCAGERFPSKRFQAILHEVWRGCLRCRELPCVPIDQIFQGGVSTKGHWSNHRDSLRSTWNGPQSIEVCTIV